MSTESGALQTLLSMLGQIASIAGGVQSKNYYVQTAAVWYFAEVAAKNFDATISFLRDKKLSAGVHEKTIQKICEGRKFSDDKKSL